jgi:hypothetical protein
LANITPIVLQKMDRLIDILDRVVTHETRIRDIINGREIYHIETDLSAILDILETWLEQLIQCGSNRVVPQDLCQIVLPNPDTFLYDFDVNDIQELIEHYEGRLMEQNRTIRENQATQEWVDEITDF